MQFRSTVATIFAFLSIFGSASPSMAQEPTMTATIEDASPGLTKHIGIGLLPLGSIYGGFGAQFDVYLSRGVALTFDGIYAAPHPSTSTSTSSSDYGYTYSSTYDYSYSELNLGTTIMLTGSVDRSGLYLRPSVGMVHAAISNYSFLNLSGELNAPQARATLGYQWTFGLFHLAVGGGLRAIGSTDIVIKNSAGTEIYRQSSSSLGGAALDFQVGLAF